MCAVDLQRFMRSSRLPFYSSLSHYVCNITRCMYIKSHLLCTVTFHMAVRTTLVVSTVAWQVYSPPWDVRRGLNVRTPTLTVISSPVVTLLPLEYCHWMDGVPITATLQVSVYICSAVDMPESVMVTSNGSSRKT